MLRTNTESNVVFVVVQVDIDWISNLGQRYQWRIQGGRPPPKPAPLKKRQNKLFSNRFVIINLVYSPLFCNFMNILKKKLFKNNEKFFFLVSREFFIKNC